MIIVRPDKGNGVVILEKENYLKGMHALINDKTKFKLLEHDLTEKREGQLQRYLLELKKKGFFTNEDYKDIYPNGSQPSRMYGLPKLHKNFDSDNIPKFRPICSSIGSFNYKLAKHLSKILTPLIPNKHSTKDTFNFIKEIQQVNSKDLYMVSYDVCSLYTNIPLKETIEISVEKIFENNPHIKITKDELKNLFYFATSKTHFQFEGSMYDQIDGIAMGSPLAPTLANMFMGFHEEKWLNSNEGKNIKFYKRYVDDIFCLVNNEQIADSFLEYLNTQHENIKFTLEKEKEHTLPFLDISIKNTEIGINTSVFKKPTDTGLLTNFSSFVCFKYKICLIKTLIDRIFKINNSSIGFHNDIEKMKHTLQKNNFPNKIIDKNISNSLKNNFQTVSKDKQCNENVRYFKLPYIGSFSSYTENKLKNIIEKYCKLGISIKLAFTSSKISSYFSLKDKRLQNLQSHVVYVFSCNGCNSKYVGYTTRYLTTRIDEHLLKDKNSHIFKHINSSKKCKDKCTEKTFKILDRANTEYALKQKESMHIKWLSPNLNIQKTNRLILSINI